MATSVSLGYCAWLAGATFSDTIGRNETAGMTTLGATRSGVLPNVATPLLVSAGSGMNVNCAPGAAVIANSSGAAAGPYLPVNNVTQGLTHNASDPTNPRIDLWSVQVVDNGNATSFGQLVITAGTPAASPAVPATPSNALALAQVRVNAGVSTITSANITDMRVFTAMAGGIIIVPNRTNLPVGWPGLIGFDISTSSLFQIGATGAKPLQVLSTPPGLAIRTSNLTVGTSGETTALNVNFTADGVSDYEYVARHGDAWNASGMDWLHMRLYYDSTLVQDNQCFAPNTIGGNYHYGAQNVVHVTSALKGTTPSAGAHTISLRYAVQNFSTTIGGASYMPIELSVKQASM